MYVTRIGSTIIGSIGCPRQGLVVAWWVLVTAYTPPIRQTHSFFRTRPPSANLAAAKAELLAAMEAVPDRGLAEYEDWKSPPTWLTKMAECVDAISPLDPSRGDWMVDDNFDGDWQLVYTSSPTFRRNRGLCGYAAYVAGVETPELRMRLLPRSKLLFEEPLDPTLGRLTAGTACDSHTTSCQSAPRVGYPSWRRAMKWDLRRTKRFE